MKLTKMVNRAFERGANKLHENFQLTLLEAAPARVEQFIHYLGNINFQEGERLIVQDPCYGNRYRGRDDLGYSQPLTGEWRVYVIQSIDYDIWCSWGRRNAYLVMINPRNVLSSLDYEDTSLAFLAVDSGQMGFFRSTEFWDLEAAISISPEYFFKAAKAHQEWFESLPRPDLFGPEASSIDWHIWASHATNGALRAGILPQNSGAVSSSGYGDGCYHLTAYGDLDDPAMFLVDFGLWPESEQSNRLLMEAYRLMTR